MSAAKPGRIIGVLLLVQLFLLILPFVLLHSITTDTWLQTAAAHTVQIRVAVLLLFANGALTIGIAIAMFPVLREHGLTAALWLAAASVLWFAAQAVDNAHILSMLSLSEGTAESIAGELARTSRRWAHYTTLLIVEFWFLAFYGALFRYALVPRALAAMGVVMVLIHAGAVTLPTFLSYPAVFSLAPSLAVSHVSVAGWLIARGLQT